jgi:hypothetical protein
MNHHFLTSKTLYADFTYVYWIELYVDPRNFLDIRNGWLHEWVLKELSKRLIKLNENATAENSQSEFSSLVVQWNSLKNHLYKPMIYEWKV